MSTGTVNLGSTSGSDNDRGGKRRRYPLRVLGVAVLVVCAILFQIVQWANGDGPTGATTTSAAPAPGTGPAVVVPGNGVLPPISGATRMVGPVPVGYPNTQAGAVAAATNYLGILNGSPILLTDAGRTAAINAAALPDKAAALDAQLAPGLRRVATALSVDQSGKSRNGALALRVVPLGYSVTNFTADKSAVIQVWHAQMIGVAGGASQVPVQMTYWTGTVSLVWDGKDWKWSGVEVANGPSLTDAGEPGGEALPTLPDALRTFTPYVYGGVQ